MRALIRMHLGLAILMVICIGRSAPSLAGDSPGSATKAYSPFDEPRPKVPQEIIDDKRLGQKVKVFVKSKNMKQIFADLSAKTGVKITANRELWGERPIIYFHKRPLRDVMTEVSGLYGYYWLISGKSGAYEYELFEDISHAKRRDEILKKLKAEQDDLLVEFTERFVEDDKTPARFAESDPTARHWLTSPSCKEFAKLVCGFGTDFLSRVLAHQNSTCRFTDLPAEQQWAIVDWLNAEHARAVEEIRQRGHKPPALPTYNATDLAGIVVRFKRDASEPFGMPRLLMDSLPEEGPGIGRLEWPPWPIEEDDIRRALGHPVPEYTMSEKPLPEEPKITADKPRWFDRWRGLLVGDVLQAIGEQSEFDVIADYYFQEGYVKPFTKLPLNQAVGLVCETTNDYSCQVAGATLRFRYYPWFTEKLTEEPSAPLIEECWKEIGEKGILSFDTMVEIACLPDKQRKWPGLRCIPYAGRAALSDVYGAPTLRMWRVLGTDLVSAAESEECLPVSKLDREKRNQLLNWARLMRDDIALENLEGGTVRIRYVDRSDDEGGNYHELSVGLTDGTEIKEHVSVLTALGKDNRKGLIDQRKADAEADAIEVLQ